MSEYIVIANGLKKIYDYKPALNEIDLCIRKGKIVGLLGPNGSGKTTFIKLLAGLLRPTKGSVLVDGMEVGVDTKAIVSYLPERTYFNSWMKVSECLDYFQDFYADFDREKAEYMLRDLKVDITAKLKTLSKGTKEKVQLVLVMARRAKLYLLDEPIAGVDPAAREYILDTIIKTYNKDATVIISTHLISDIENVLDDFIFINNGKIFDIGSAKDVLEEKGMDLDAYFREVFKCSKNS